MGPELMAWKEKHYVGDFAAHPSKLKSPDDTFMARQVLQTHVDDLKESFCTLGSVNEDVQACVVSNKLFRLWQSKESLTLDEYFSHVGPSCWAGAHTRTAVEQLNKQFPSGKLWKKLKFHGYVCQDTEENMRMLRYLGNQNNSKNKVFLDTSFPQIVESMHRQGGEIRRKAEEKGTDESELRNIMRLYKSDVSKSLNIPPNSVGQIWQVAKRTGTVWELFWLVLQGNHKTPESTGAAAKKAKAKKVVKSCSFFTQMMGMSPSFIEYHLMRVVEGTITLQQMAFEVIDKRAELRTQEEVVKHISARFGIPENFGQTYELSVIDEENEHEWLQCLTEYPDLEAFVEQWMPHVKKLAAKDLFPPEFKKGLEELVAAHELAVVSRPCFFASILFAPFITTYSSPQITTFTSSQNRSRKNKWMKTSGTCKLGA